MKKPRLLCVIPHAPALDSCLPLLARLQERGRIRFTEEKTAGRPRRVWSLGPSTN